MIGSILKTIGSMKDSQIILCGKSPNTGGTTNTSTSIELDTNASSVDGAYDPSMIVITKGTGAGQSRYIFEYDGATKKAYVNRDWKVTPDDTSEYCIIFSPGDGHVNEGVAQGGGADYITLNALASSQNDIYQGQMIFIVAGTGADQSRMCVNYVGAIKRADIDSPWTVQPDNTSVYMTVPFPGFIHGRPAVNSSDNVLMRDIIGNKNDFVQVPYTFGIQSIIAHLNTAYYHVHGKPLVYPNHADNVLLTAGAGAWNLTGNITEIIPANALSEAAFDLHWINISAISANGTIQIDIYSGAIGAEVLISSVRSDRNTVQSQEGPHRIQIPQQPANTRISARLSDSTAGALTCEIAFEGHYYKAG